jgi:hypothetical protein
LNRNQQIEIIGRELQNANAIVSAFLAVGADTPCGFTLASVCATVEDESGGENVFGGDPWDSEQYPRGAALPVAWHETPVTRWKYTYYKLRRNRGMQPNGVGPGQLTSVSLQLEAERCGGCWRPEPNLIVAFHYLKQLFQITGSAEFGYQRYNGSGPEALAYGSRLMGLRSQWTDRLK